MNSSSLSGNTFLGRYRVENWLEPINESEICTVHFAFDVKESVVDIMYKVAVNIMNSKENLNSEKNSRSKENTITWSGEDIPEDDNMY